MRHQGLSTALTWVNTISEAIWSASRVLMKNFHDLERIRITQKKHNSVVTHADRKTQQLLIEHLTEILSCHVIAEEHNAYTPAKDNAYTWIIDPIDGTYNFLHGVDYFAVSVALVKGRDVIAGVVYNPIKDEWFYAQKDQGAFHNGRRIHASKISNPSNALVGVVGGMPSSLRNVFPRIRYMGSCSLDMCYAACGRFDGVYVLHPYIWDVAAAWCILQEAECSISSHFDVSKKKSASFFSSGIELFARCKQYL